MKKVLLSLCFIFVCISQSLHAEEDNAFIVCDNSMEMLDWDLSFIRQATRSIEILACYSGGKTLRSVLFEVEKRLVACPELKVNMLSTPVVLEEEDKKLISRLEKTYSHRFRLEHASSVLIVWPDVSGIDNHLKMLIVDETYFSCGGTNLDQFCCEGTSTPPEKKHPMGDNFPAGSRDQDVVGRGPFAKEMREAFYKHLALWENYNKTKSLIRDPEAFAGKTRYYSIEGAEKPFVESFETYDHLIPLKPSQFKMLICGAHQKNNVITAEYARLIREAKEEILIANLYFSPADPIMKALMDAVNRGVKVTVVTNGVNDRSPGYTQFFCWANRVSYVPLLYGRTFRLWESGSCQNLPVKNVKIYEYYVKDVLLHKKIMIVDGRQFVVGSYNLGSKSDMSDYEMVLSIDSKEIAEQAKIVFRKDLKHSIEVTPKEARDWYFDPFIAYLGDVQKKFHGLI